MPYKCDRCGYTTNIKCNFNSHLKRKIPCKIKNVCEKVTEFCENVTNNCENVTKFVPKVYICEKCNKGLASKRNLRNHRIICNGVNSLSCPTCKTVFENRRRKHYHMKHVDCKPPPPPPLEGSSVSTINNNITNNNTHNNQCQNYNNCNNQNITINAFGKETYAYITENHEFMKQCLKDREYGLLECLKMLHYNQENPENQNIKKTNRKDDFVDIYDGSKWKLRMIDYAYTQIMQTLEKLFTDYIDNIVETDQWDSMKRLIKIFCNKVSTVLDWEFENIDKNREVEESEMKSLQFKLKKLISETLYRETINES